jgi:hypothetical protein
MRQIFTLLLTLILIVSKYSIALSQPATEIYLFDVDETENTFSISNPRNISKNEGYDNQPYFLNDEEFVYAANYDNQTDIVLYNLVSGDKKRLTKTPESEYSPKPTINGKYISAVLLSKDGKQTFAKYSLKGGDAKSITSDQKIGYYCWFDKKTIFSFVVGSPPSLQEWNTKNSKFKIIMMNPGRSLHNIPNQKSISFVHKESDDIWYLNSYNPENDKVEYITEIFKGSEDIAWTQNGMVLTTKEKKLYKFSTTSDHEWSLVANMEDYNLSDASRIAISPNGKLMAIVIDEE